MKRVPWLVLAATSVILSMPMPALADSGATLSFFSGGDAAHADWLNTTDQPAGDTDHQAIELQTTNDAPTFSKGYAGILVHHVAGTPAASFPDSSFWVKTPTAGSGATLGSPRLVVEFQKANGAYDGDAELDQNVRLGNTWQQVSDVTDSPNSGWDIHYACTGSNNNSCLFAYHQKWSVAQADHAGDTVLTAFLVADPYGIYHLIDDINVAGKTFSSAADNGNGSNTEAGPSATTDPSLLPPLTFPPL